MKRYIRYMAVVFIACALSAGCKSKAEKETLWGIYQEPVKAEKLPPDSGIDELQVLWRKRVGDSDSAGFASLKPAYYGGHVFVANRAGDVYRLDGKNGDEVWKSSLKKTIYSAVAVLGDLVVVTHDNGEVTGLDAADGSTTWMSSLKRQFSAIPAIGRGRVIIRTTDGLIIGLNSGTGEVVWQVKKSTPGLSVHGDSVPVITGDAVLVGLSNGRLIANNVITGRDYWETELSFVRGQNELERLNDSDTPPIIVGTTVFTAAYQGNIVALNLLSAEVIWRQDISTRLPMTLHDKILIITTALGSVVAVDAENGSVLWEQTAFRGHGVSPPIAIDDRALIGDANGNIHTLDMRSGALVETKKVASGAMVGMILGDDQFTVLSSEGDLNTLFFITQFFE